MVHTLAQTLAWGSLCQPKRAEPQTIPSEVSLSKKGWGPSVQVGRLGTVREPGNGATIARLPA